MKELGEKLKARRQEMNLSLREVENSTSIRLGHLQAIEAGDMSKLISHIYAQGFVKQYANFLGLNGEEVIKSHPELFQGDAKQHFSYGIGTLEHRGAPSGAVSGLPSMVWVVAFAAVSVAAWFLARYLELI